jgi:hypothetical protein
MNINLFILRPGWLESSSEALPDRKTVKPPKMTTHGHVAEVSRRQCTHFRRMLVEPAPHRLENVLMLPSSDSSLLAGGAAVLDSAVPAGLGLVAAISN